jgi:hypothetical protein
MADEREQVGRDLGPNNGSEGPDIQEHARGATLSSGISTCRFDAQAGGRLVEWEWRGIPGGGAVPLVAEGGALVDHFLPLGTLPKEIVEGSYRELGDFAEGEYRYQTVDTGGERRIGLLRDGAIRSGKRVAEIRLAKSAALRPDSGDVAVLYRVINSSLRPLQILFSVEFNLFAPGRTDTTAPDADEAYYLIDGVRPDEEARMGSAGVSPNATHVALANPARTSAIQLGWDRECDLWRLPPQDGGAASRLFAVWRIQLPPRDNWAMGLWLAPA